MEPDSQSTGEHAREPASADAPPPFIHSRKAAWAGAAALAAATVAATVWGVQAWQTSRAIADVESSLAGRPLPSRVAPASRAEARQQGGHDEQPDQLEQAARLEPAGPGERVEQVSPAPAAADRLPPLILPGQPVSAAVLRDLPEWVAAEVAPAQTSGASGDESAAPAPEQAERTQPPQRQRSEVSPRKDRYGAVFARCPGPGESGAVECRRAVCDGAAKKTAACAHYLK